MANIEKIELEVEEALIEGIQSLRKAVVDLLEILRRWEPDHASAEDRRTIMLAMYQVGILSDPAETVGSMKVGAGDTATEPHNAEVSGAGTASAGLTG